MEMSHLRLAGIITSITLLLALVTGIVYVHLNAPREAYTEFYLLNKDGKFEIYAEEISLGDTVEVIAVIVNHEQQDISYTLAILSNGIPVKTIEPISLSNNEKWENSQVFSPLMVKGRQNIEFILSKQSNLNESLYLNFWIDVQ